MSISGDYITRSEYETRHSELRTEMIALRTSDDVLRRDMTARFDTFDNKLDALNAKVDNARVSGWKLATVSILNFVVGGGLVALLSYLHFPR